MTTLIVTVNLWHYNISNTVEKWFTFKYFIYQNNYEHNCSCPFNLDVHKKYLTFLLNSFALKSDVCKAHIRRQQLKVMLLLYIHIEHRLFSDWLVWDVTLCYLCSRHVLQFCFMNIAPSQMHWSFSCYLVVTFNQYIFYDYSYISSLTNVHVYI
jgi:hypothetical protein